MANVSPWLLANRPNYGLGIPQVKQQPVTQEDINMLAMNQPQAPQQPAQSAFGFTPFLQTPEGQQIAQTLTDQRQQAIDSQKMSLGSAQKQLEQALSQKKEFDVLPLAALTDTWSGSNLAPYYQNQKDKNAEIALALQQEILRGKQGLVGSQTDLLKERLGLGSDEQKTMAGFNKDKYLGDQKSTTDKALSAAELASKYDLSKLSRESQMELAKTNNAAALERAKLGLGKQDNSNQFRKTDQEYRVTKDIATSPEAKATDSRVKMIEILNKYEDLVNRYGLQGLPSGISDEMSAIYSQFKTQQKNILDLGALTKDDLRLVMDQMPDASSAVYAGKSALGMAGGKDTILKLVREAKSLINRDHEDTIHSLKNSYGKFGGQDVIKELDDRFRRRAMTKGDSAVKTNNPNSQPKSDLNSMTREQKIEAIKKLQGGK